jgi:hypothetical protein
MGKDIIPLSDISDVGTANVCRRLFLMPGSHVLIVMERWDAVVVLIVIMRRFIHHIVLLERVFISRWMKG